MHDVYNQYLNGVLNDALNMILDWSFPEEHPLEQCSDEVKEHVKKASQFAKQKRYDEAIEELTKASEKEPNYVGTYVRTMKYLIDDDKPLVALVMCGSALSRSNDAKIHSQALDMASEVAMDCFEKVAIRMILNKLSSLRIKQHQRRLKISCPPGTEWKSYSNLRNTEGKAEKKKKPTSCRKGQRQESSTSWIWGENSNKTNSGTGIECVITPRSNSPKMSGGWVSFPGYVRSMKGLRRIRTGLSLPTSQLPQVTVIPTGRNLF